MMGRLKVVFVLVCVFWVGPRRWVDVYPVDPSRRVLGEAKKKTEMEKLGALVDLTLSEDRGLGRVDDMIWALSDESEAVVKCAAGMIVRIGVGAVDRLEDFVGRGDPQARGTVVSVIGRIEPESEATRQRMYRYLKNEDPRARLAAIGFFYDNRGSSSDWEPRVRRLIRDKEIGVRLAAEHCVLQILPGDEDVHAAMVRDTIGAAARADELTAMRMLGALATERGDAQGKAVDELRRRGSRQTGLLIRNYVQTGLRRAAEEVLKDRSYPMEAINRAMLEGFLKGNGAGANRVWVATARELRMGGGMARPVVGMKEPAGEPSLDFGSSSLGIRLAAAEDFGRKSGSSAVDVKVLYLAMASDNPLAREGFAAAATVALEEKRALGAVTTELLAKARTTRGRDVFRIHSLEIAEESLRAGKFRDDLVAKHQKALIGELKERIVGPNVLDARVAIENSRKIGVDASEFESSYAAAALSNDAELREEACEVLAKSGARSVPYFAAMLGHANAAVRGEGMDRLALFGKAVWGDREIVSRCLPPIMLSLFDRDRGVRDGARGLLAKIGGEATEYAKRVEESVDGLQRSTRAFLKSPALGFTPDRKATYQMAMGFLISGRNLVDLTLAEGVPGMEEMNPAVFHRCVEKLRDPVLGNRRDAALRLWRAEFVSGRVGSALVASVEEGDFVSREGFVMGIQRARLQDEPVEEVLMAAANTEVASVERTYARAALRRLGGK